MELIQMEGLKLMSSLYAEPAWMRMPRAKIWRRGVASTIDFALAWMLSVVGLSPQASLQLGQWLIFIVSWLVLRVVIASKNQGQSPGHWAMDMMVIRLKSGKVPDLQTLVKRESALGLGALLVLVGLTQLHWGFVVFVLVAPLAVDCGVAFSDALRRQTLHDRWVQTVVVHTYRGFSLDIKVRRLVQQLRRNVR